MPVQLPRLTRDLPQPPGAAPPSPTLREARRLLLLVVILALTAGSAVQYLHFEWGMLITQWVLIFLPVLIFWRIKRPGMAGFARLRPLRPGFIPVILLLAASTWVLLSFGEGALHLALEQYGFNPPVKIPPPETLRQALVYAVVVAVSPGICEEVLFRGTFLPAAEKEGRLPALILSSLLFSLVHLSLLSAGSIFLLGVMIGLVVIKTQSLYAGMLYHFFSNLLSVIFLYGTRGLDTAAHGTVLSGVFLALLLPAAAGLLLGLRLLQRLSPEPPILGRGERWLPRGWFSLSTAAVCAAFLAVAAIELLAGFGLVHGL